MIVLMSAVAGAAVAALLVYSVMRAKLAAAEMAAVRNSVAMESERKRLEDMQRHYEEMRTQGEAQFKALAQRILDERSEKLKTEGSEQLKGNRQSASREHKGVPQEDRGERCRNRRAQCGAEEQD